MSVNASIVCYHTPEDELRKCLDSLLGCGMVSRVDLIDNGSEPRLRDFAAAWPDPRVAYTASSNVGYGAGHNISMRRTLAEAGHGRETESAASAPAYHLVINSDVYFREGTLEKCIGYMDTHPRCGQLIPRTVYADGAFQPVCHPLPSPVDLLRHRFVPARFDRRWRSRYEMHELEHASAPVDVPYHHGCFMLLRTDALRKTGLFDERFFMYPEDIDLTRRIHEHYETIYFPGAEIVHDHRAASRHSLRMLRIHAVNMLRYFRKWGWR